MGAFCAHVLGVFRPTVCVCVCRGKLIRFWVRPARCIGVAVFLKSASHNRALRDADGTVDEQAVAFTLAGGWFERWMCLAGLYGATDRGLSPPLSPLRPVTVAPLRTHSSLMNGPACAGGQADEELDVPVCTICHAAADAAAGPTIAAIDKLVEPEPTCVVRLKLLCADPATDLSSLAPWRRGVQCEHCSRPFGLLQRRHHCRLCGASS